MYVAKFARETSDQVYENKHILNELIYKTTAVHCEVVHLQFKNTLNIFQYFLIPFKCLNKEGTKYLSVDNSMLVWGSFT